MIGNFCGSLDCSKALIKTYNDNGELVSLKHKDSESDVTYSASTEAVTIYNEAIAFDGTGEFSIFVLTHGTHQKLLLLESAEITEVDPINFNIYKRTRAGSALDGIKISVTAGTGVSEITSSTDMTSASGDDKQGYFGNVEIIPEENEGTCKVTISEEQPGNYYKISNTELTITYSEGKITNITPNIDDADNYHSNIRINHGIESQPDRVTSITLVNDSRVTDFKILKTNKDGDKKLSNTEFELYLNNVESLKIGSTTVKLSDIPFGNTGLKIENNTITLKRNLEKDAKEYYSDRVMISGLKTNGNGEIEIKDLKAINSEKYIIVRVEEKSAPSGYSKIPNYLWMILKYNGTSWELIERTRANNESVGLYDDPSRDIVQKVNLLDQEYFSISGRTVQIKDDSQIDKLTILKTNAQNATGLQGAKFNITISNVKSIKGYSANSDEKVILTNVGTNSNGNITLENLIMADSNENITVEVVEAQAPNGYKKINGKMTITITRNGDSYTIVKTKDSTVLDSEFTAGTETVSGHEIALGIKNIPNLSGLNLSKKDFSTQKGVANAEFKVEFENVKSVGATSATNGKVTITTKTDSNGNFVNAIENIEILDPTKNIVIKVTETAAPIEHKQIDGTIRFEVKLTGSTYSIENVSKSETILDEEFNSSNLKLENNEIVLGIKNIPNIKDLAFSKKDFSNGKGVANAEFKVEFENVKSVGTTNAANGKITITTKTDANGNFINAIENIEILDQTKNIVVKVTETAAPIEHKQIDGTIRFEIKLSKGTYIIENISKSETILDEEFVPANLKLENYVIELNIKNILNIQELALNKTEYNSQNTAVAGAEFKLEFENVESVGTKNATSGKIEITTTTDSKGNFKDKIEYIEILDTNNTITIKVTETKAPVGYKRLEGTIEFKVKLVKGNYQIDAVTIPESVLSQEFTREKLSINNYKVSLNIQDVPVMNLGGVVWEDTQTGIKEVQGPDGKYNNGEKGISGVPVQVYKANGEKVTQDMYGNALMTKTASEGAKLTYKLHNGTTDTITLKEGEYIFPNLEKGTDYYVEFTYDGINYKTVQLSGNIYSTTNPKESKVEEVNRNGFNAKFKTISDSTNADSSSTSYATASSLGGDLSYVPYDEKNGVKTSKLLTRDASGNVLANYQMKAKSKNYLKQASDWKDTWTNDGKVNRNSYALDVNCGLTFRFFDLSIFTDIENAELTINGKSTTYDYNQILDGVLTDIDLDRLSNESVSSNKADKDNIIYNLYLYYSDYYYRISDYLMEGAIENNTVKDEENDNQVIKGNVKQDEELRAFVTYKVIIKNQSTIDKARVNKLAYYYDTNYEFVSAKDAKGNNIVFNTAEGIKTIKNAQNEEVEKKYAEISGFAQDLSRGNDYRQELYFTFEVKKSEDGTRSLPKDVECANIVEILSYSTDEGFVDNDSCPGNVVAFGYEDDTDEAQGINIKLREEVRQISGTVFEDLNKDGNNNDSKPVNDVIVQLIEVKQINGKYYEYIWQETRSGSNSVKTTARNGYAGEGYTNSVGSVGGYNFNGFIPGDYIVRFIYGDGTTYTVTDNVKQYNGQDYQSTVDGNYKAKWYNNASYEEGTSVARDNEARRLEVMAYSAIIDKAIGEALENKTALNETWMAAETSRINIPVDANQQGENISEESKGVKPTSTGDEDQANGGTKVSFGYIKDRIEIGNVNFGLALRPQNKLILEKHITGLKITPNGTGVQPIVDAKATISDIVNGINVKLDGIKTGLTAIKSVRDNRGFWKVETDIEELAQGAQLEVEYTYVVRNESDIDYLSSTLVEQYQRDALGYANYLKDLKKSVKAIMRMGQYAYSDSNTIGGYLGQFYYTGNKGGTDTLVSARAETLKESLNEQLAKQQTVGDYFNARDFAEGDVKTYIDRDGNDVSSGKEILTVIESKDPTKFLIRKAGPDYTENDTDWTKTAKITTVLSAVTNGEIGGNYPSYIAEIIRYSNAAGRRNMEVEPENLSYVHSEDTTITMNSGRNEEDEFWGESIIISKPTGEDKQTGVQIAIITTISVAILGLGIVLIKKFVLKK